MSGRFISFEGIDGAGKSTHIDSLRRALTDSGHTVTMTREPGGTPLAEALRELLLHRPMDALTEALLAFAARRDHLAAVIRPALARGDVVLCDRFSDATFAYQGGGRGLEWQLLEALEQWVQRGDGGAGANGQAPTPEPVLQPDLTLWFDLDPAVAAQRLGAARTPDRFEAQPEAFFARVAGGYARRAHAAPARFVRIHADQAPAAVWAEVLAAVRRAGLLP